MITKRRLSALLLLFVFALTVGCGAKPAPDATAEPIPVQTPRATTIPTPEPTPTPDPVAEQLAGLSLEQKVGQLFIAGIEGTVPGSDATTAVQQYQVGGIIFFGRNVESADQLLALTNGLKALNGSDIPLFLCVDQEGGRVDRMPPEVLRTPGAYSVGQSGQASVYGTVLAETCAAFGLNMDFAPCLDIWSNPDNTVIGDRSFGTEWETVSSAGFDAVDALRAQGDVIPVVKHFPGHGDTAVDSHKQLPVVKKTLDELWQSELLPFDIVLSGDYWGEHRAEPVPAVMVAHILMQQIDAAYPASLSGAVVTGLLREEMGFEGVVCTDDLTMGAISNTYGMGDAAVLALEAGCDLLLVCHKQENLQAAFDGVMAAVQSGRITEERLDESVSRILSLKRDYHVTNEPAIMPDLDALNEEIRAFSP